MGTFAEVLSEATERAARPERHATSPFAAALRAFEDRLAGAAVPGARPLEAQVGSGASSARYAARSVAQPAPSSINVAA